MKFTVHIQAPDRVNLSDLGDLLAFLVYPQILGTLMAFA